MKSYILSLVFCILSVLGVNAQKVACATNVIQIVNGKGVASQKSIKNSGLSLLKKSGGHYIYGNNVEIVNDVVKPLNNHACYLNISNTKTLSAVIYFKNKVDANKFWNELMSQSYIPCKGSANLYEKVHNNVVYHVVQKPVYKNGWHTINLNAKRPVQNDKQATKEPTNPGKNEPISTTKTNGKKDNSTQKKPSVQGAKSTQGNSRKTPPMKSTKPTQDTNTNETKSANKQVENKTTKQPMRLTPESPRKD